MNVLEMHIEIDQALQEIDSNATTIIKPHEKDLALISAEDTFIRSRLRPRKNGQEGFEIDQVYADDIQPLYSFKKLKCYFDDEQKRPYIILPQNYRNLRRSVSHVYTDRGSKFDTTVSIISKKINTLNFITSTSEVNAYNDLSIKVNNVIEFNLSDHIKVPLGYKEDKFILRDLILRKLNEKYDVYWETYDNSYHPDSFIFVTDESITTQILVDGETKNGVVTSKNYKSYNLVLTEFVKDNRTYKSDEITQIIDSNHFYSTYPASPVAVVENNKLSIFVDDRFIVNYLTVYYVRKQRRISLLLNQSSELPESTHATLCRLAVEKLKGNLNSKSLNQTVESNIIRTD